jgi:hypothetical protein
VVEARLISIVVNVVRLSGSSWLSRVHAAPMETGMAPQQNSHKSHSAIIRICGVQ